MASDTAWKTSHQWLKELREFASFNEVKGYQFSEKRTQ